jgi:pre-rRNA-processing protein TSR1
MDLEEDAEINDIEQSEIEEKMSINDAAIEQDDASVPLKKRKKKSLRGVSDYQAAWIVDSDSDWGSESLSGSGSSGSESLEQYESPDESETSETIDVDPMEEKRDLEEHKRQFHIEDKAQQDKDFPDHVELEDDTPARLRFQKYRGIANIRNVIWEDDGYLPPEYDNICQFDNFKRSEARSLSSDPSPFQIGELVSLDLRIPKASFDSIFNTAQPLPLVCFGLLLYEDMTSVLHFTATRSLTTWSEPIRSKDSFISVCGYRTREICPIFSDPIETSKKPTMSKYLGYFHEGTALGTYYGNVQFGSPPVLLFKRSEEGEILAITGVLSSIDPSKCIIKRIVLSGHPFKINRKSAVVRFMFFSPEDVNHFKNIPIYTKSGKQGQIISSLGTHGYMKCLFDRPPQQEPVCMSLYKRVFPKCHQ